ncbi:ORF-52 [Agrotis segetum nucleopolyhedrovirus A]|uniref:ORF-52 n=1 Tax=Agrotis segetum nuclear polyhedrosis virus TaxID=1962501 RepID=Q287M0_NPVAS|nr:ORF-52 [Agrotis segetum nucleopolyhedrovirus A]AAZ38218.1 ORF-52 [Agrotis segetum nucleopolyhedrovirus A]
MHSYKEHLDKAQRCNVTKRVMDRELNGSLNKVDTALAINRLYCIMTTNKTTQLRQLNNDNRKCPYLYEAEAIDFNKSLYRTHESVKRCVMCTRALHPMLDIKRSTCAFCAAK